ncbi:hypothetical protein CDD83_5955 [Cordyceps sp. RAO-2017]|nr:hypothetical protein CDD83_5955 [Cordyceps sp. RAO-2017]
MPRQPEQQTPKGGTRRGASPATAQAGREVAHVRARGWETNDGAPESEPGEASPAAQRAHVAWPGSADGPTTASAPLDDTERRGREESCARRSDDGRRAVRADETMGGELRAVRANETTRGELCPPTRHPPEQKVRFLEQQHQTPASAVPWPSLSLSILSGLWPSSAQRRLRPVRLDDAPPAPDMSPSGLMRRSGHDLSSSAAAMLDVRRRPTAQAARQSVEPALPCSPAGRGPAQAYPPILLGT